MNRDGLFMSVPFLYHLFVFIEWPQTHSEWHTSGGLLRKELRWGFRGLILPWTAELYCWRVLCGLCMPSECVVVSMRQKEQPRCGAHRTQFLHLSLRQKKLTAVMPSALATCTRHVLYVSSEIVYGLLRFAKNIASFDAGLRWLARTPAQRNCTIRRESCSESLLRQICLKKNWLRELARRTC